MSTGYKYDVFISYKRDQFRSAWLNEYFVPLFSDMLQEDIASVSGREAEGLFFDQTQVPDQTRKLNGIEPGDDWQAALRTAIKASRCVVCLWSPRYFLSQWCRVEWQSFEQRAPATKLVVPMSVHDGKSFPEAARKLQFPDFSKFVVTGAGFKKTRKFVTFQDRLKLFSETVAQCVHAAPPFADFPVIEPARSPASKPPDAQAGSPAAAITTAAGAGVDLTLVPDVPQQRLS